MLEIRQGWLVRRGVGWKGIHTAKMVLPRCF